MKIAKIDMSKVKGNNAFADVQWKNATPKEMAEVYHALSRVTSTRKPEKV